MNRTLRRCIFVFFLIAFFLSAAVLLLYANGYRYHIGKNVVEKTGQLLIETEPKGAAITLDGAPSVQQWSGEQATSPATIPYLFSGQYRVTLSRPGFHDWIGTLSVFPGRTTIKNDIILIRDDVPLLISPQAHIRALQRVADGIIFDDGRAVHFFNNRTSEVTRVYDSPTPIVTLDSAPSGTRLVLKNADGWHIIEQGVAVLSIKETKKQSLEFRWAKDDDVLYSRDTGGISLFDEGVKTFIPLVAQANIIDFLVDNELVFLSGSAAHPSITFFDPRTGKQLRKSAFTPPVTKIQGSQNGLIILQDAYASLYLFDRFAERPVFQNVTDSSDLAFLSDRHFFTYNDFEIWNHEFSNDHYTRALVTRQSEPLSQVLPFTTVPFLLTVSADKNIHIRDLRVTDATSADILLASFDSITTVFTDTKETTLWIVGSREKKSGIFSLPIIEREELFPLVK